MILRRQTAPQSHSSGEIATGTALPAPGVLDLPRAKAAPGSHSTGPEQVSRTPFAPEPFPSPLGGAATSSGALMFAGLAALFAVVSLLISGLTSRLRIAPDRLGSAPFVSLLERPG